MATPAMGPAIRGARKIAPMIPPVIGDIIGALPVPDWLRRTPAVPRPSLLEPPEERGAPPGTSGGTMRSEAPDDEDGIVADGAVAPPGPEDAAGDEHPSYRIGPRQRLHEWPADKDFVPGRDAMPDGRSAIRPEEDPQAIADDFAGTGEPGSRVAVGEAGSKERVDTGRIIGTWRDGDTGETAPTTRATIHYGKNGRVHIVPAPPGERRQP